MRQRIRSQRSHDGAKLDNRRLSRLLSLWLAAVAIGFGSPGGVMAMDPPTACLVVGISSLEPTGVLFVDGFESADVTGWSDPAPAFSATDISDVVFEVTAIGDFEGDAVLQLRVVTPNHHLYQELIAPVSSVASDAGLSRPVAGFPHPLTMQHLSARSGDVPSGSTTTLKLAVGGTLIVQSSLYGLWEVSAFLDGSPAGCDDPGRFVVVE